MRTWLAAATLLLLVLSAAAFVDPLTQGLTATYFSDTNWSSTPIKSMVDPIPSTDALSDAWSGSPPEVFSTTWAGSLTVLRAGAYTLATTSDDGSWLYVDGRLVVDNGGHHAPHTAFGVIRLDRGVHEIFIRYFQDGGDAAFELQWGEAGGQLGPVPAWTLWARHAPLARVLVSILLRRSVAVALWAWLALLLVSASLFAAPAIERAVVRVWSDPILRTLAVVVAGSTALNVIGISWGLPSAWIGDELTPKAVLIALSQHFSSGWFDRYPPLHFYVLTAVYSPLLALDRLHYVHLSDDARVTLLSILGRLTSIAAACGTMIAVYVAGARAFGRRAGLFAAAALGLVPIFVFYAKAANPELPFVFWFAVALVFYLRALDTLALRDIVALFVAAALSVCTKDQAYALFLTLPFVLMTRLRSFTDRRIWIGGAVAALVFVAVQNIPLNAHGFVAHVRDITGPGRNYRMFDATLAGQAALLRLTLALDVRTWGWPLFAASAAGLVVAVRRADTRASAIRLTLIVLSYYLGFVAVILYDYDRYLLPVCVVQALFAGVALDALVGAAYWRRLATVAILAYSLLYAAMVDVLMTRDSRYDAERWLSAHVRREQLVGTAFPRVVEPRLARFDSVDLSTVDDLRRWRPDFFVLNADYAGMLAPHRPEVRLVGGLRDGTLGYSRVYRYRTPPPWPWLPAAHPDLAGARAGPVVSFLWDINPAIEIFRRDAAAR